MTNEETSNLVNNKRVQSLREGGRKMRMGGVVFMWGILEIACKEGGEVGKLVLFNRYDRGREGSCKGR